MSPLHVVMKIILHSNIVSRSWDLSGSDGSRRVPKPGSPLFQRYKRCNWEIQGTPEDDEDGGVSFGSIFATTDVLLVDTPPRKRFYDRVCFRVSTYDC
jgi:hypothetical protein